MVAQIETPLIELTVEGTPVDVESVRGTLTLSRLFCFLAHVVPFAESPVSLSDLVGKDFSLTVNSKLGDTLSVYGVVASCAPFQDGHSEGFELELCPHAQLRSLRRNHRVFQDSTVKAIVNEVLTKSGSDIGPFEWKATGTFPEHAYVAQAGESDWDFIARIIADAGVYYHFRFDETKTVLVFANDSAGASPISGTPEVPLRDANLMLQEASVTQTHHRVSIATDRVRLRDYDPQQPTAKLDETVSLGSTWREYYDAPGRFVDSAVGQSRAQSIGEALRAEHDVVTGRTSVLRMHPGLQFTLTDHEVTEYNTAYFITELVVLARQERPHLSRRRRKRKQGVGLSLRFSAIPLSVPYRSAVPGARIARGPETAIVVGPSGEEIHTDDSGHARAQFYWDREGKRDQTASTWMRVGQFPLAGSMMLPRMHWDQLIAFNAGDVDAPMVVGHLYDSNAKVPYALPANKTRTAWQTATTPANGSANEIRYEDKAGAEEVFLNASYDMAYEIGKDSNVTVGVDHATEIGVNQTWSVGSNQSLKIGGAQEVSVGAMETLTVSGSRSCLVNGNDSETVGVARTVTATAGASLDTDGGRSLTAGAMMMTAATMGVERMVLGEASITVGGAWIAAAGTGIECVTAGSSMELIGGAKIQAAGGGVSTGVKGKASQTVGGALISAAGGNVGETSGASLQIQVGGAMVMAGPKVVIEAKDKLVIKVGGTTLTMTPSKIHLKSPSLASPGATIAKSGSTIDHNP